MTLASGALEIGLLLLLLFQLSQLNRLSLLSTRYKFNCAWDSETPTPSTVSDDAAIVTMFIARRRCDVLQN